MILAAVVLPISFSQASSGNVSRADDALPAAAMGLLFAVAFEFEDGVFHWGDESVAVNILQSSPDRLARSLPALTATLYTDDSRKVRRDALLALTWNGARYKVDYQLRSQCGEPIWIQERGERLSGSGASPTHIQGVMRLIDSEKSAQNTAAYLAAFDALTGLWNQTRLTEALDWQIAAGKRFELSGLFYALKLTNLDDIHYAYGFEAGDRLLKAVAQRLSQHIRAPDYSGRLSRSGFEGAVLGMVMSSEGPRAIGSARIMAAQLRTLLTEAPYPSPYGDVYVKLAIAASDTVDTSDSQVTAHDVIERARVALNQSVANGGEFTTYSDAHATEASPRDQTVFSAEDILESLNSRALLLAYQPIVHAKSRQLHHYECLLRLRRPCGQIMSAGDFIAQAERLGLVHFLDRRALDLASDTLREQPSVTLAVNVSAATLTDEMARKGYMAAFKALGPDSHRLIIELTETAALDDPAVASQFSTEVRALGGRFAIDDFGAGFTSFQNLMAIEANEIKIDGAFIQELSTTPHKQTFVRMMVDLAQTFSVKTVAEYVETPQDAELLTRLGVDYLQGYLFGAPDCSPDWPRRAEDLNLDVSIDNQKRAT